MPVWKKRDILSVPCIITRIGKKGDYWLFFPFVLHCVLKYFGLGKRKTEM